MTTTITAEGRRIRANIMLGVAALALVMVALVVVSAFGSGAAVDGPAGSAFVTTSLGVAGLEETLTELGADVGRSRTPISADTLEGVDTLLTLEVAEEFYDPFEIGAIHDAVDSGMTLITSGRPNTALVTDLVGSVPDWRPSIGGTGSSTIGTASLVAPRFGTFLPGPGLPLVVSGGDHLVIAFTVGRGRVVMFSDTASLANQALGGNAGFVVDQTGIGNIVFDEFRHGFTEAGSTGLLQAAPDSWTAATRLVLVAIAIALFTYGRRFGPAEPEGREFVPSRRQLVESVASSLRRAGSPAEATEPVRELAKLEIRRRSLIPHDAGDAELRAAATGLLSPAEVAAIFEPGPDTVLVADRALARLRRVDG